MMASIVFFTLPESKVFDEKDRARQVHRAFTSIHDQSAEDMQKVVDAAEAYVERCRKEEPTIQWEIVHWVEVEDVVSF